MQHANTMVANSVESSVSQRDSSLGQVVAGRYDVVRLIGQGGMGTVYEVVHRRLNRRFALKRISARLVTDPKTLVRFRREADVIAKLRHPNIVDIVDWETLEDGSPCIIMEFLEGEDLADRLHHEAPLSWPEIGRIGDRVLSALSVAHRAGIVHRDLKPDNIFLSRDDAGDEHVKLMDFGVSKIRHAPTSETTAGLLLGTPAYMSPEQARGDACGVGSAADVWSMGAILFEMATGRTPFSAPDVVSMLYQVCHAEPASLLDYRPDAPPELAAVIARALCHDPVARIMDADQLRREFRAALDPLAPGAFIQPLRSRRDSGDGENRPTMKLRSNPSDVGAARQHATPPALVEETPASMVEERRRPTTTLSAATGASVQPTPDTRGTASWLSRSAWAVAGGLAVLVAGGMGVAMALQGSGGGTTRVAIATPRVEPRPPEPRVPVTEPLVTTVQITIESSPSGAQVYLGAAVDPIGTTPYTGEIEQGSDTRIYYVALDGYKKRKLDIGTVMNFTASIELERTKKRRKHRGAKIVNKPVPRHAVSKLRPTAAHNRGESIDVPLLQKTGREPGARSRHKGESLKIKAFDR